MRTCDDGTLPPFDPQTEGRTRSVNVVNLTNRDTPKGRAEGLARLLPLLMRNDKGGLHPILANAQHILTHDPIVVGLLSFNEFDLQPVINRSPPPSEDGGADMPGPYPRAWGDADTSQVATYLQRTWAAKFSRQTVADAMLMVAMGRRYHPVRQWLATLQWDGQARISEWLTRAFGCPLDPYHCAVGSKLLIAAVRRVRQPGCKFDYLLVLEGVQGIRKSTALAHLFGARWFTDSIPTDLGSKDAAIALLGKWCIELSEIEPLIRTESETVKSFLSRGSDRYRPPYGRSTVEIPRQSVLIGTTNSDDYLRDSSGNRRIWPVRCCSVGSVDIDWITENRDQLWAEAAALEEKGASLWLDESIAAASAKRAQSERLSEDAWEGRILSYIAPRQQVQIPLILSDVLFIETGKQIVSMSMRVARTLKIAGWTRATIWDAANNKSTKIWNRPPPE